MWTSLREYVTGLGKWGWAVGTGILVSVTGMVLDLAQREFTPRWAWVTIGVATLLIAPFISFHFLREDRDRIKAKLDRREQLRAARNQLRQWATELEDAFLAAERERCQNIVIEAEAYVEQTFGAAQVSDFRRAHNCPSGIGGGLIREEPQNIYPFAREFANHLNRLAVAVTELHVSENK